jgi:hypothetical protein
VEGCGIRDELNGVDVICTIPKHPSTIKLCVRLDMSRLAARRDMRFSSDLPRLDIRKYYYG